MRELEIGVMFWAGGDPRETLGELRDLGVQCGQLGLPGDLDLSCADAWGEALRAADFRLTTVFAAYSGESYADKPTVQKTVGFIPPAYRAEREERTRRVSDFAAALGVPVIATHIGCLPEDQRDPAYVAVRDMVRRICDYAGAHGQKFALETGQESAPALLRFLENVGRGNLGINFDPANMILYGTGDPNEALEILGAHLLSVHCKDGDWPPAGDPNALGVERPLGEGAVGIERFIRQLVRIGYSGPLVIEREAHDAAERRRDIEAGIRLLRELATGIA